MLGQLQVADGAMQIGVNQTLSIDNTGATTSTVASGTLFANAALLLGDRFSFLETTVVPDYRGFLLFALPSGGFIALGFILAGKRALDLWLESRDASKQADSTATA